MLIFLYLPVIVLVIYLSAWAVILRGEWFAPDGRESRLTNGFGLTSTGPGVRGGVMAGVPMSSIRVIPCPG